MVKRASKVVRSRMFGGGSEAVLDKFEMVFWMGDLNYRVKGSKQAIRHAVDKRMYEVLRANDQLQIELKRGNVFKGFQEGQVFFPPTFKFHLHTDNYNWKRIPSWTDRILWRPSARHHARCAAALKYYCCVPEIQISDHRPVVAGFDLAVAPRSHHHLHIPHLMHSHQDDSPGRSEVRTSCRVQ